MPSCSSEDMHDVSGETLLQVARETQRHSRLKESYIDKDRAFSTSCRVSANVLSQDISNYDGLSNIKAGDEQRNVWQEDSACIRHSGGVGINFNLEGVRTVQIGIQCTR